MTVKDLITQLSIYDPNASVLLSDMMHVVDTVGGKVFDKDVVILRDFEEDSNDSVLVESGE